MLTKILTWFWHTFIKCPHTCEYGYHEWGEWSKGFDVPIVSGWSKGEVRRDFVQIRICKNCMKVNSRTETIWET